jgi:hypothetical protein
MIKFFRKIRQRLLSENKFSKYILYAVGEIILVVFGILIALQINNWNEYQKMQKEEKAILFNLKNEFDSNLPRLRENILTHELVQKACVEILARMGPNPKILQNSCIDSLLAISYVSPRFKYNNGALKSVINSGKLAIIRNESIRHKIAEFPGIIESGIITETSLREISWSKYAPLLEQNTLTSKALDAVGLFKGMLPKIKETEFSYNQQELLSNANFENHLVNRVLITQVVINELNWLETEIKNAIEDINRELEK